MHLLENRRTGFPTGNIPIPNVLDEYLCVPSWTNNQILDRRPEEELASEFGVLWKISWKQLVQFPIGRMDLVPTNTVRIPKAFRGDYRIWRLKSPASIHTITPNLWLMRQQPATTRLLLYFARDNRPENVRRCVIGLGTRYHLNNEVGYPVLCPQSDGQWALKLAKLLDNTPHTERLVLSWR
ncbi:MAG TPA: hypothetical protein VEC17_03705 [Candidatus Binatia bacterium]|nr:hypothetical protein [Candidatus Binatia bacterium]